MEPNFSKLDDTRFPNFDTVHPYSYHNNFDYSKWFANTKVKIVNVLWNSTYDNVVKFKSNKERDEYFDSIDDAFTNEFKSNYNLGANNDSFSLPIPYDTAARYNYAVVDVPIVTSDVDLLPYENPNGVRRWFFFIDFITYEAPSTTNFHVSLDTWTTYINETKINYLLLERGHAPVSATNVDKYLADPINNNKYLMAPDVNFDDETQVNSSKFIPFGSGTKYICFASTVGYDSIDYALGVVKPGETWSDPTFSDTGDWFGWMLQVNNFGVGNGQDFSDQNAVVDSGIRNGNMTQNGLAIYAIYANDSNFLKDVERICPVFMRTIKACFVVDGDMLNWGKGHSIAGHTMWECVGVDSSVGDFKLNKEMFGYDKNESRFAKLYTYPYAYLELSNNRDKTVKVRIERTGNNIGVKMLTSVAFPVLDCRVFFTGINGVGSTEYEWKTLDNQTLRKIVPNGDWDKVCFDFDIPTYSIYMSAETAFMLNAANATFDNGKRQALVAYHNSVRSSNAARYTSAASANTGYDNSIRQADTAHKNSLAMANTTQANTGNLATCSYNNITAKIQADVTNRKNSDDASKGYTDNVTVLNMNNILAANQASITSTNLQNEASIATTKNSSQANVETSTINGAVSGAMSGGGDPLSSGILAIAGGITGAITAGITADSVNTNASIITQARADVVNANNEANKTIGVNQVEAAKQGTGFRILNNDNQTLVNTNLMQYQGSNNYNTTVQNAKNLHNTSVSNADNTYNTAKANASESRDTSVDNAARMNNIGVLNAQETLRNAGQTAKNAYLDAKRGVPVELTATTGDGIPTAFGQQGIQIRVRVQNWGAVNQAASHFARFGYALNQAWDVGSTGFTLMKNFTYWKASDIWVDVQNVASSDIATRISDIFMNGVTIWDNPNKIGKVNIYDN